MAQLVSKSLHRGPESGDRAEPMSEYDQQQLDGSTAIQNCSMLQSSIRVCKNIVRGSLVAGMGIAMVLGLGCYCLISAVARYSFEGLYPAQCFAEALQR